MIAQAITLVLLLGTAYATYPSPEEQQAVRFSLASPLVLRRLSPYPEIAELTRSLLYVWGCSVAS
jgi:hypothetical protein